LEEVELGLFENPNVDEGQGLGNVRNPRTAQAVARNYPQNSFIIEKITSLHPFDLGLSYTCFEYHNLSVEPEQVRSGEHVDMRKKIKERVFT